MKKILSLISLGSVAFGGIFAAEPPSAPADGSTSLQITECSRQLPPTELCQVANERYDFLQVFQPNAPGWVQGNPLRPLIAQECTVAFAFSPASVRATLEDGTPLQRGEDFEFNDEWGTIGRVKGGKLNGAIPVLVSYEYRKQRIDSIVRNADGTISAVIGVEHIANPAQPEIPPDALRLANVYHSGFAENIQLCVIDQEAAKPIQEAPTAAELLPKTLAKLRNGEPVKILAWGDSVTDGSFVDGYPQNRWQNLFADRLQQRFPQAKIELVSSGWGGRTSNAFVQAPEDSPFHYPKLLATQPDLVVVEFVNDAYLADKAEFEKQYDKYLADFTAQGAEMILLTPHYIYAPWMGWANAEEIGGAEPRAYVRNLREFARDRQVALADGAKRYEQLKARGIPYMTLMLNAINHPNSFGMSLFADSLMCVFPEK